MRTLPILFNTEMVKAILAGRKTITRRLIKHNTEALLNSPFHKANPDVSDKQIITKLCKPPYEPGDVLYVRETWCWCPCWDCGMDTVEGECCEDDAVRIFSLDKKEYGCYCYRASCADNEYPSADTWHPSIHMPKAAARIFLKVKEVRAERLQDICGRGTPQDHVTNIAREGIQLQAVMENYQKQIDDFKQLWNSTIKKTELEQFGWDANPYVWVIEFERCEKPEDM